ncbi:aspartate/glutamate racemase family protein [Hydrogenophaga sp.]|uniref:aspartate/glutamate racemase family protein n=1 Tax=Hydrogenophaga sp. TaxID=1904254 RepID=UPI002716E6AA|nr:aspartate/glutamate racemase family protein [Hydrogenophaga sp.]MDO9435156.1 aspartate/glutamate racemase family protein [Hydrogenophaga sp.]
MQQTSSKYRFLLINAFSLPPTSPYLHRSVDGPKEKLLVNHDLIAHHLEGVDWELHPGALTPYGDWPVESREEFCLVAAARLPIVREACESGKYNGIVLLGGGEPGVLESREIARPFNIPVTSCGYAQMHFATLLGNKFSVIDLAEVHNMYYYNLVVQHRFDQRCASIRNLNFPLPRPGHELKYAVREQKEKALRGEPSEMVEAAVEHAVAAIEEDGAEVITFGCSAAFWMQPFLKQRLLALGWDVPVLEGYSCAIELAKSMVNLNISASALCYPDAITQRPRKRVRF